jgi:hypothetical protein
MVPSLGQKYEIKVEIISKPRAEYQTDEYFELDLPTAPAVMVDDEIVVEGSDVAEDKLENVIRKHLGLPELEPEKKGLLGRLFGR